MIRIINVIKNDISHIIEKMFCKHSNITKINECEYEKYSCYICEDCGKLLYDEYYEYEQEVCE